LALPLQALQPTFWHDRGIHTVPDIEALRLVTKGKKASSTVLRHLCGNVWCTNPFHIELGTKAANDEEEHCHHFLRQMSTLHQMTSFRNGVCALFHAKVGEPPCWTNVYNAAELDKNRLSMSMLPLEEVLSQEEEAAIQEPGIV
jgi:hypothetical protein